MLEWNVGAVDDENPNGSFEFEAESGDENDFFPMTVRFNKTTPYVDVDVSIPPDSCRTALELTLTSLGYHGVVVGGERGGDLFQGDQVGRRQLFH